MNSTVLTEDIPELIAVLASSSPMARKKARLALVALGGPAVPSLVQLLSHRQPHVRWEAAKSLGAIADPLAASALVNALEDRDGDVRWLAAEGLAALGRDALQPLLTALVERSERHWLCEGTHHVCHALVKKKEFAPTLRPLLAVLDEHECEFAVPVAAYTALSRLRDSSEHTASAAEETRKGSRTRITWTGSRAGPSTRSTAPRQPAMRRPTRERVRDE